MRPTSVQSSLPFDLDRFEKEPASATKKRPTSRISQHLSKLEVGEFGLKKQERGSPETGTEDTTAAGTVDRSNRF